MEKKCWWEKLSRRRTFTDTRLLIDPSKYIKESPFDAATHSWEGSTLVTPPKQVAVVQVAVASLALGSGIAALRYGNPERRYDIDTVGTSWE